jgi:hypothetical protein
MASGTKRDNCIVVVGNKQFHLYLPFTKPDMSLPQTDAGKMLHEIMHINLIRQDRPHIFDRVFNGLHAYTAPTVAAWVASGASVKDVINNADSHTHFANGIYWENTFGYLPPPDQPKALTSTKECIGVAVRTLRA